MIDVNTMSLEEIQQRILSGDTLSPAEYRAVIDKYRGDRRAAAETSAKSRGKRAPAAPVDLDTIFGDLGI